MIKEQFQVQNFGLNHDSPLDFSICCWQKTLEVRGEWIAYRTIMFGIFLGCLLQCLIFWVSEHNVGTKDSPKILIYLTYWTFFLEVFLFFWGLLVTVVDYLKQSRGDEDEELSIITKVFWVLYTIALPSAVSVTLVFWIFVYDNKNFEINASNLLLHVFNSVLIVFDFWLVAFPFYFLHFYMPEAYLFVYIIFTVIYELSGGTGSDGSEPIYNILDWKNQPLTSFLFFLMGIFVIFAVHTFFSFLYIFKIWLAKKYVERREDDDITSDSY